MPFIIKHISLGNIMTLATVLVTGAFTWGQLSARLSVTEATLSRLDGQAVVQADLKRLETQINEIEPRLREVEQKISAQDATLDRILETMVDIRNRLDRQSYFPNHK